MVSGSVIFATAAFSFGSAVTTACVYPDGSASGIGTVSGTIAARSSLILTASGNTSQGSVLPSVTYNSTFDQRYDTGSSIAAISGNWTGPAGVIMSIDGGGVIFAQDPASGCVVNGTISVIDSHYDVYSVRIKYGDCQGANAVLNGASASGLASLDQSGIPSVLDLAYTVTLSGGQKIIVAAEATR
ncbi:MAG: hypothetical protein KGL34_00410 [Gammaproteobacteria bacterium]|nr:hypothetical protein [Gammaproteobacteria bacterium]